MIQEDKMKISIALATYNGEKYLQEQLDSYLKQERLPDELIVCDDVSSDNTVNILEAFKVNAPFDVKIITNESNLGYTKNFEKALSLCLGDIVFFSDQDDIWSPLKISTVEKVFYENTNISVVIHDAELVHEDLKSTGLTKLGQIISGGYKEKDFATGTLTAIRKDILNIILPFPDGISGGHDGWVHTISRLLNRRMIIKDVLQKLRRHSNNTSQWIVSSTKKINKLDVMKSQFSTTVANSYSDRLLYNKSLQNRFDKFKLEETINTINVNTEAINNILKREHFALTKRELLLTYGFLGRKIYALFMLINGDYKYFNGLKSFARDFIR